MSELPDFSTWRVQNADQALTLIQAQMQGLAGRRAKTFEVVRDGNGVGVRAQRTQYALLMVDYGFVMGLLEMAHAAGLIADEGYYSLKQDAHRLTMPGTADLVGAQLRSRG